MRSERTAETRATRDKDCLMKRAAGWRIPSAHQKENANRRESSAEPSAVMRNQRNQPWIDVVDDAAGQPHEPEVFGHEHLCCTEVEDHEACQGEARSSGQQSPAGCTDRCRRPAAFR